MSSSGDHDSEYICIISEIQDAFKTIKDNTLKRLLSSRLTALLEDLEKEEPDKNKDSQENEKTTDDEKEKTEKSKEVVNDNEKLENLKERDVELIDLNKPRSEFESEIMDYIKRVKTQENIEQRRMIATEEEMKHLAMHNIILQGLVGHMDLNEVYNNMHLLMNRLEQPDIKIVKKGKRRFTNPRIIITPTLIPSVFCIHF